jgi:DegT/DnrJ/EryC1/StrS aminotransferase family
VSEDADVESRWRVPLSDITVDDELTDAVLETLRSGWWSMGPRVAEFERAFAEFCGAPHALAVANGTVHFPPIRTFSAYREAARRQVLHRTDGVAPGCSPCRSTAG